MKVIIIGGGEVGFHVAKALSEEDYDIPVVDNCPPSAVTIPAAVKFVPSKTKLADPAKEPELLY